MASFSIKLCDHTGSTLSVLQGIQSSLKGFYDRVFAGSSDTATVGWGQGARSDDIVLHFVADVPNSYIQQVMPGKKLDAWIGGHTRLHHHVVCSEFYKSVVQNGTPTTISPLRNAKLAFHESLHNVWPGWKEPDLMGHGGLADSPVGSDLNQRDIDLLRRGIAIKGPPQQL